MMKIASSAAAILSSLMVLSAAQGRPQVQQPVLGTRSVPILSLGHLQFRDLDRNGRLSPFEDWRLPPESRAIDLVRQMSLDEKAGAMVHEALPVVSDDYDLEATRSLIQHGHVNSVITRLAATGVQMAQKANALQEMAEATRLAIPLTISTDPRNHFQHVDGASVASAAFSKWPEATGFAAIGDVPLVEHFADIARQEYRAAGIQIALSPQADLATEPRWPRINGTFGEDPAKVQAMVGAYVRGFQNSAGGVTANGVATVVKHWVGYGASDNGYDGHSFYGRHATLTAASLKMHADAFRDAFKADVAGVMPAYSIVRMRGGGKDARFPEVGAAFNRHLVTDLLRKSYGFRGLVLSDWGVTKDCGPLCRDGFPRGTTPSRDGFSTAWGMEDVQAVDRFARGIAAGIDQFGGVSDASPILAGVRTGRISKASVDQAVIRIMTLKFRLGLFENPYVDPVRAEKLIGNATFQAEGQRAQARALVILKKDAAIMPLPPGKRVYLIGVSADAARSHGLIPVADADKADFALARLSAPWLTEHPQYFYGARQHEGSLEFRSDTPRYAEVDALARKVPTVIAIYMDRPAVLTPLTQVAAGLVVDFGASDEALLDGLAGRIRPEGHLPFNLPSSQASVDAQRGDLPNDLTPPLFPMGYGLSLSDPASR